MKKIEYQVVESWDKSEFEEMVRAMLNRGWQLQGGVSITFALKSYTAYAQALTRISEAADVQAGGQR